MCETWLQRLQTDVKCPSAPITDRPQLSDLDSFGHTGQAPVGYWCHLPLGCVSKVIRNDHLSQNVVMFMKKNVPDVTTTTPSWRQMPQRAHHRSIAYLMSTATGVTYHSSVCPKALRMTTWVGTQCYLWNNVRQTWLQQLQTDVKRPSAPITDRPLIWSRQLWTHRPGTMLLVSSTPGLCVQSH